MTTVRPGAWLPPRMRTWWIITRISLEERLVYRGEFMLGTLMRFLPIITQIFLWRAVFTAANNGQSTGQIGGYSYGDFIAYYLLTMVGRAFSSMPGHASSIARSIRDGTIKKFLIQPVDMIGFLLLGRVAHKIVYYGVAILPFALVFYLCREYFVEGWPPLPRLGAFCLSLGMAFLLGYFLETAIGLIGFWFLEVSSLLFIYMLVSFFMSGQMFPLDLLDRFHLIGAFSLGDVVRCVPLQYLAYFPAAIFLGKIQGAALARGLLIELAWLVGLMILCRIAYHRGVRRYSAFGG